MNLSMNIVQEVILFVINIVALSMGFVVYRSDSKNGRNIWFLVMSVFMTLWVNFAFLGSEVYDVSLSTLFYRLNWVVVAASMFVFYYFFVGYFLEEKGEHLLLDFFILLASIAIGITALSTDLIVASSVKKDWGMEVVNGPLSLVFNLFAIVVSFAILYFGIKKYISSTRAEKRRVAFFFIGIIIFIIANVIFNVLVPLILNTLKYQHFGDFSVIFFLAFAAYAMVKHRLFDVKLAIVRSVTYIFVLVSLACLYLDIVYIISGIFDKEVASPGQIATGVVTSLILAFVFQPLKQFFDKVTNKIFYKDNYNTDDFFTRVNESLTTTTDLRNLLEQISHEIGNTLKSEQTFFYINTDQDHHVSAGTQHHRQLPKADADKLGELCGKSGDIVIASMLEPEDEVRRLLLSHRIELILPLVESNKIIGYLCLGDHRSNSGYTNRDVKALNAVSDEIAIAIQNALAVQEIREFNSTLQQRIENATKELRASNSILRQLDKTKDEFVGMASHQLRTPLTSVKGYISMVLEGDAGKVSDMQRKFLEEAFMSSERMVRLIDDFLNVSRIQNGKFIIDKHEVDLSKVVEQEIDSLSPSAKMRNLKFVYKPATDVPTINIDEGKIRQVIMNFADNALYYSHDNTEIAINLSVEDGDIVFTVKDTGIGVPISEQAQLFSKFYRASNARKQRPDGTGVGLYLAKKVIDAHGGKVIFFSIEGKGSMFGFRIPIDQKVESTTAS